MRTSLTLTPLRDRSESSPRDCIRETAAATTWPLPHRLGPDHWRSHRRTRTPISADRGIQRPVLATAGNLVILGSRTRPTRLRGVCSRAHRLTTRGQPLGVDDHPPSAGAGPNKLRAPPSARPASATSSSSDIPRSITDPTPPHHRYHHRQLRLVGIRGAKLKPPATTSRAGNEPVCHVDVTVNVVPCRRPCATVPWHRRNRPNLTAVDADRDGFFLSARRRRGSIARGNSTPREPHSGTFRN